MDFYSNRELRFEILQLLVFGCQEEAVIVETKFTKGNRVTGFFRRDSKFFERFEEGVRAVWVLVKVLRRARMHPDSRIT